jgi:methylmalonyl-CoA mutase N-terminal domain/subunit
MTEKSMPEEDKPLTQIGEAVQQEFGHFPFRRGIRTMDSYQKVWTMRQYSGFGSIKLANSRFKKLIEQGATGISIAFDLPTQLGLDSDDPQSVGEVGRVGVAVDTLEDMRLLFEGIDIKSVSTSMTINATAPILLLMYELIAHEQGIDKKLLRGTIQNDILKEFISRGNYIFPPEPSLFLATITSEYCIRNLPNWNFMSVSGYHMAEAGATAAQEIGFALTNAMTYVKYLLKLGISPDEACARISFFFCSTSQFIEQVSKFRAAREVWARICIEDFGVINHESAKLRFHAQTAGIELIAQDALLNISRITIQAMAAVLGGTQSLHTNAFDEALRLPSEKSAVLALNIQKILAFETDLINNPDPFGNSLVIEAKTNELIKEIRSIISEIEDFGGNIKAVERNYQKSIIQTNAFKELMELESGTKTKVFSSDPIQIDAEGIVREIDYAVEEIEIVQNLKRNKEKRDEDKLKIALERVADSLDQGDPMNAMKEALVLGASVGEICNLMRNTWGTFDK